MSVIFWFFDVFFTHVHTDYKRISSHRVHVSISGGSRMTLLVCRPTGTLDIRSQLGQESVAACGFEVASMFPAAFHKSNSL